MNYEQHPSKCSVSWLSILQRGVWFGHGVSDDTSCILFGLALTSVHHCYHELCSYIEESKVNSSRGGQNQPPPLIDLPSSTLTTSSTDDTNLRQPPKQQLRLPAIQRRLNHAADDLRTKSLPHGHTPNNRRNSHIPDLGHQLAVDSNPKGHLGR